MSAWSQSGNNGRFEFMDMSYTSSERRFSDSAVYVCVEVAGGSACPKRSKYTIKDVTRGGYRLTANLEKAKDAAPNRVVMKDWADSEIEVVS